MARSISTKLIADHRHHQAVRAADRDAHVDEVLVDDLVAVDLGVDRGKLLQRGDAGADEQAHVAEPHAAVLLLERLTVLRAQRHRRRHVHLVEGGQHRGGVLRLLQPRRDGAAQAGHLHPLLAVLHRPRRLRGGWRGGRRRGAVQEGEHVALGDAAVLAGALAERLGGYALLRHHLGR
jgi:hypothetical protein